MSRIGAIARLVWTEMLRTREAYVLLILLLAVLLGLMSLNVFGLSSTAGYLKDAGLLVVWVLGWILTLNVSVRQIPREEERGTLWPLLAKPISRFEFVAGKWLGAWGAAAVALLAFYLLVAGLVLARGGTLSAAALAQAYLLHAAALAVVAALGILLSARLTRDAAAVLGYVLTGSAFVILPRIPTLLAAQQGAGNVGLWIFYYLMPHFELFDMRRRLVHDFGPAPWPAAAAVLAYGAVLTALLLVLAWLAYRGKRYSRGRAG